MTSVPYPTYIETDISNYKNLSTLGRCRIFPATLESTVYSDILSKCKEHTAVTASTLSNDEDKAAKDARKKLLKKLYKQSVGELSVYLSGDNSDNKNLGLDLSIIDVEVVLPIEDILITDGLISTVFLDAGVSKIVLEMDTEKEEDSSNFLKAMEMTRLPSSRLTAHYTNVSNWKTKDDLPTYFVKSLSFVKTISLSLKMIESASTLFTFTEEEALTFVNLVSEKDENFDHDHSSHHDHSTEDINVVIYLPSLSENEKLNEEKKDDEDACSKIAAHIGNISKKSKGRLCFNIIDPNATLLGLAYAACIRTDRSDGYYTTVVCTRNNEALGLVYSSKSSIVASLQGNRAVYFSRSRNSLWRKGDTSGKYQILHRIDVDCDGDALRYTVTQMSGDDGIKAFCHLNTLTCWGEPRGIYHLEEVLAERIQNAPPKSYTKRLLEDDELLRDKLVEEAQELSEAKDKDDVAGELADVLYFAMVKAAKSGVSFDDAIRVLDLRARKVTRRQGDSKAFRIEAGKAILENAKKNTI